VKALTIRHPWPWAICHWGKDVENRTWQPSAGLLKPGDKLAIHAGKMVPSIELRKSFEGMREMGAIDDDTKMPTMDDLRGQESSIVAVVLFWGTQLDHISPWFCGPVGWCLNGLVVLPKPVPCRGAQGLWNVPADVLEKMREQFRKGTIS
jgi:hypothetical protein